MLSVYIVSDGSTGEIVAGDVITALAGKPVATLDELLEALENRQPGETITLSLLRAGKSVDVSVRLSLAE